MGTGRDLSKPAAVLLGWLAITLLLGMLGGFIAAQALPWSLPACVAGVTAFLLVTGCPLEVSIPLTVLLGVSMPTLHTRYGFFQDPRVLRRVPQGVALTFDDGPSPETTPQLLELLAEHQVRATFFLIGQKVAQHPDLARQIVAAGHEVGIHTYTHRPLPLLPRAEVQAEFDRTRDAIYQATGVMPRLVRAPWGFFTRLVLDCMRPHEKMVAWTDSTRDWQGPKVGVLAARIAAMARPGAILLLHDGAHDGAHDGSPRQATRLALAQVLPLLHQVRFVAIGD